MRPTLVAILVWCALQPTLGCSQRPVVAPEAPAARVSLAARPPIDASAVLSCFTAESPSERAPSLRGIASRRQLDADREIRGTLGPGSEYALFVPESWNGDLVLYTHGYIPAGDAVGIASVEALGEHVAELRDLLLDRGFAVGYSSYSENGFNVKEGAIATNQLREVFSSRVGHPARTFLIGQSLGAIDAAELVERDPEVYAGLLTAAGALGGSQAAIDYYAHVRILFDLFYPNVLPGSLLELPANLDIQNDVIVPAATAMGLHPEGAFAISQLDQSPVPFRDGIELGASIIGALVFHAVALQDLLDRTHGRSFFGNDETAYTSATLAPEVVGYVNAAVARYSIAPDARAYLRRNYLTSGGLRVPAITLHMRWDPVVPLFHESLYHDRVQAHGGAGLLEQRTIDDYGHPGFPGGADISAGQIADAFDDLVQKSSAATQLASH